MKKPTIIIWIIAWWLLAAITAVSFAQIPGDLNNDNRVDMKDWAMCGNRQVIIQNWMIRIPDCLNKIKLYAGRRDITMREKQMLHMAKKKYARMLKAEGY